MMKPLCFGGSFNPIHHGHLICARAVAESAGFDRVILIPSSQPPHKGRALDIAPAEHRLDMCRLAAAEQPDLFDVDDVELRRSGRSYTIDTVRALKARGWPAVHWLIGADMLLQLPSWREPLALLDEATFIVMHRPGREIDWSALPEPYRVLRHNLHPAPLIDISATQIRSRIAASRSITYLTPAPVINYIHHHRLYTP